MSSLCSTTFRDTNASLDPGRGRSHRRVTPQRVAVASRYEIGVLGKSLHVLEALASARELSVSEVTQRAGISKGAAFRILATLEKQGYVHKDADTKRYRPGPGIIALSTAFLAGQDLVHSTRPVLEQLRHESGETVNLGMLRQGQVEYLEVLESMHDLRTTGRVGRRDPLHCTALGKALLAALPGDEARNLLAGSARERHTARTIVEMDELLAELRRTRARGYAIDDGENIDGVRCVAAVITDALARPTGAISISGPAARLSDQTLGELGERVHSAAGDLSRRVCMAASRFTMRTIGR
jgi:DNA-binding IclR family transcriptional regulator